jgi:hypothetical protein
METEARIKGLGEIVYVEAPFDKALIQLRQEGAKLISLRDLAYGRIETKDNSHISENGSYVKQGAIYVPGQKVIFTDNSPIIKNAEKATDCHRKGEEFYVDAKSYLEQVEKDKNKAPEKRKAIIFSSAEDFSIPTNRFADEEITRWAFKDKAKEYGEFLGNSKYKIKEMLFYLVNSDTKKSFARQMWLRRIGNGVRSDLYGNWDLNNGDRVRGVRDGKAGAKKIAEKIDAQPKKTFSIEQILKESVLTSDFALNQIKKLDNTLEQCHYIIIKK